jgi:hypothetical protein
LAALGAPRKPAVPLTIADPVTYWTDGRFAEMVPPIRLPTSPDGNDHITVWLRIPDGQRVRVERTGERSSLVYPPGTVADRVEMREPASVDGQHVWHVTDVRGTRLGEDGRERFHSLQPAAPNSAGLEGFEWRRDDADGERIATEGLADIVGGRLRDANATRRARIVDRMRSLNHCQPCHEHDRPERTRISEGTPRRPTDSAGFYVILSTLSDSAPLESHRPRELNADDSFVTVRCGSSAASLVNTGRGQEYRCEDDQVPVARLDLSRALSAVDPHALAVCRSRRYLYEHMDEAARTAFAPAFVGCGIRASE